MADLRRLMELLGIDDPRRMVRTAEPVYTELGLDTRPADEVLVAVTQNPILLERPILVVGSAP